MVDLKTGGEHEPLVIGMAAVFDELLSILVIQAELEKVGTENMVYHLSYTVLGVTESIVHLAGGVVLVGLAPAQ